MAHEHKLTAYTLTIKPVNNSIENSNRCLFRNIIGEVSSDELEDSYIIAELFKKFITALDRPEMFSDTKTKKCMTANQPNIEDSSVNPNIILHSEQCIIEGIIEGGSYGRKRNKTNTENKLIKSNVDERDAITEDFYFLIYLPLQSNKMTLLIQSYSDDAIDGVMKKFWQNFFSVPSLFFQPNLKRFVPASIVEDFKNNATVNSLTFATQIPGSTLLENTHTETTRNFKVTVKITPTNEDFSINEFEQTIEPIQEAFFTRVMKLGNFTSKKGSLRDTSTNVKSPFDLGSSFEIQPSILLSKYITINLTKAILKELKHIVLIF
ncbi:MAG: hypothetical protein M3Q58_11610 [Bacteroidota bacterium]|nr:hypothetical protein [Bacteroidota bacterium]